MEHAMQWLHNHTRACWSTFLYTDFQSCDLVKIDLLAFFQFPGSKMEISMQWNDFLITPGQVHLHFLCYCCFHFLCLMCFMYLFPMRSNSAIVSYLLLLFLFFKQKKNECRYNLHMSKYWIQKLFQSLVQKFFFVFIFSKIIQTRYYFLGILRMYYFIKNFNFESFGTNLLYTCYNIIIFVNFLA